MYNETGDVKYKDIAGFIYFSREVARIDNLIKGNSCVAER
jgi:hypothetical protein